MNVFEPVRVGFSQLQANKLRSFLTLLGLLIGVASVTGIVALAEGLRTSVTEQLDRLGGSSLIFLSNPARYYRDDEGRWIRRLHDDHLVMDDIDRILEEVPNVRSVIPHERAGAQLRNGKVSIGSQVSGATLGFNEAMDWHVERGRWINQTDMSRWRKVIILGPGLATDLFGEEDPVGEEVKVNGERYDVIGVMESKRIMDENFDDMAVMPITTLQKRMNGRDQIDLLQIRATLGSDTEQVVAGVRKTMRRYHRYGQDFTIETADQAMEEINQVILIMKLVFGGIAGISLLVGGIGIMNIMLVSVTERTREVGIRKAVGARRSDIMIQFLVEAIVLSVAGGALGLAGGWVLGQGLALLISNLSGEPFIAVVNLQVAGLAIAFSALIGIFFGVYPARRASRLDPVEALRYE
ncbi:ABC transporter permease [Gemmatimonadota bacterium]